LDGTIEEDYGFAPKASRRPSQSFTRNSRECHYEKGRLESRWLHRLDGKLRKGRDYLPVFRASRHWNWVRILRDVGLLELGGGDEISITADGRRQLSRMLKTDGTRK
jgi:hypothetical protein